MKDVDAELSNFDKGKIDKLKVGQWYALPRVINLHPNEEKTIYVYTHKDTLENFAVSGQFFKLQQLRQNVQKIRPYVDTSLVVRGLDLDLVNNITKLPEYFHTKCKTLVEG